MSLATRITLLVVILLGISTFVAGAAFHRLARRSLESEVQGKLDARLAWLAGAIEVEEDDGEVQLEPGNEPIDIAEYWQVALGDGKVLWTSAAAGEGEVLWKRRNVTQGAGDAPVLRGEEIVVRGGGREHVGQATPPNPWQDFPVAQVPEAALRAAREAVRGFELQAARRRARPKRGGDAESFQYILQGRSNGREQEIRVSGAGEIIRVRDRAASLYQEYEIPAKRRLELVLSAGAPAGAVERELASLARILWIVGPMTVAVTGLALVLLIRRQLRPLARIASHASRIGPSSINDRIEPVGHAPELVQLRESINAMLARLDEALAREQRFAATAAHELRTPLAQMRTALEVALRRPREAGEYREALEETASDVQRLQKLVIGLLELARSPVDASKSARAVSLEDVLATARKNFPAVALNGQAAGIYVFGERDLSSAAVSNVLENAARYAQGSPAEIDVKAEGEIVQLAISDRGPGIAPGDRERIFEPLTRLGAGGGGQKEDGVGLGLSIARATMRAFGGDLVAGPRADNQAGARFVFTFKKAPAPARED